MFDYQSFSYDGQQVSYSVIPKYMIDVIMLDDRITLSAFKIFIRLMAYASAVNSCRFKITHAWLEKNTGLSDKTVSRAMAQLTEYGYVDEGGIVYSVPPQEAARSAVKQSLTTQSVSSVQVHHFPDAKKMVEMSKPQANSDQLDEDLDVNEQANAMLARLGIHKKVVIADKKTGGILSETTPQNSDITPQNSDPYITIPNNTLLKNTPTAKAEKPATAKTTATAKPAAGLFSDFRQGGVVIGHRKPNHTRSVGEILGGKTQSLSYRNRAYIDAALIRMRVTSTKERERYSDEIAYACTQGAFANTFTEAPIKALRACLNLVEAGKWTANAGMY